MHFHQLFFNIANWSQNSLPLVLGFLGLILTAFGLYYSYWSYKKSRSNSKGNEIERSINSRITTVKVDNSSNNGISGNHVTIIVITFCLLLFAPVILFFIYPSKTESLPEPDPIKIDTVYIVPPPDSIRKDPFSKEREMTIRVLNTRDMEKFSTDLCHAKNYQSSGFINEEIEIYEQIYSEIKDSTFINNKQLQIAHEYYIRTEINASVKAYRKIFYAYLKKCSHNS